MDIFEGSMDRPALCSETSLASSSWARCNFLFAQHRSCLLTCEPAGGGPNHGGQHDSRSNDFDYSDGLRHDWHDYAG